MIRTSPRRGSVSLGQCFPCQRDLLPPVSAPACQLWQSREGLLGSYLTSHSAGFSGTTGNTLLITGEVTLG